MGRALSICSALEAECVAAGWFRFEAYCSSWAAVMAQPLFLRVPARPWMWMVAVLRPQGQSWRTVARSLVKSEIEGIESR